MKTLISLLLLSHPVQAETETLNVDHLVAQAEALRLDEYKAWLRLGHWRPRIAGLKSDADGPGFFLSRDGRTDPKAELEATIRGLFRSPTEREIQGNTLRVTSDNQPPPLQHPVCRFPARVLFLASKLDFAPTDLAVTSCPKLAKDLERSAPVGASMVFSSYYLESPASVFGHTFLRIHRRTSGTGAGRSALIDDGLNFGADPGDDNALIYAFRGLFGLYPGRYQRVAYYYKVAEYNDFDSRDIWEYDLNLTQEELLRLVLHIWELDSTWFNYFYRSENCSYQLNALLEAVRPEANLLPAPNATIVPIQTVRDLQRVPGMMGEIHFRPSLYRKFTTRVSPLNREERRAVRALAEDPTVALNSSWSPKTESLILDATADLIDLRHSELLIQEGDSEPARRKQAILARRAALGLTSAPLEVTVEPWDRPDLGHGSQRVGVGAWRADDGRLEPMLSYRLAMHDLTDPVAGYPELNGLEFLGFRARLPTGAATPTLDELTLVRLMSIPPLNSFSPNIAKRFFVGGERLRDATCSGCFVGRVHAGPGFSLTTPEHAFAFFGFGEADLRFHPDIEGLKGGPILLGSLMTTGVRARLHHRLVFLTQASSGWTPAQTSSAWTHQAKANLRAGLSRSTALDVYGSVNMSEGTYAHGVDLYFYY